MIGKTFNLDDIEQVKEMVKKVIALYVDDLLGISEVAFNTGININTIRKILSDNNIKLRQRNFRK